MMKKVIRPLFPILTLIFLYAPILILAFFSFTDATQIGAMRGFTFKNYVTLFTTEELRSMIIGTLLLALGSALLATILGTLGAIGSFYSRKRISSAIATVNQIPVINADVVTGFSICILLVVVFGVSKDTYVPLVVGHVVLYLISYIPIFTMGSLPKAHVLFSFVLSVVVAVLLVLLGVTSVRVVKKRMNARSWKSGARTS